LSYVEDNFVLMICHAMSVGDKSLMYDIATLFICDIMFCVLSRLHLFTKESLNKIRNIFPQYHATTDKKVPLTSYKNGNLVWMPANIYTST